MRVNSKEYNKDDVKEFFSESRRKAKEHSIDDKKEPLNKIIKVLELLIHIAAVVEEVYKNNEKEE